MTEINPKNNAIIQKLGQEGEKGYLGTISFQFFKEKCDDFCGKNVITSVRKEKKCFNPNSLLCQWQLWFRKKESMSNYCNDKDIFHFLFMFKCFLNLLWTFLDYFLNISSITTSLMMSCFQKHSLTLVSFFWKETSCISITSLLFVLLCTTLINLSSTYLFSFIHPLPPYFLFALLNPPAFLFPSISSPRFWFISSIMLLSKSKRVIQ